MFRQPTASSTQTQKEKFAVEEFEGVNGGEQKGGGLVLSRREYGIASNTAGKGESSQSAITAKLIDSMPQPSSLFSFNKLLAAFSGAGAEKPTDRMQSGSDGLQLKSAPILKVICLLLFAMAFSINLILTHSRRTLSRN